MSLNLKDWIVGRARSLKEWAGPLLAYLLGRKSEKERQASNDLKSAKKAKQIGEKVKFDPKYRARIRKLFKR